VQTRDGELAVAFVSDISTRKKTEAAVMRYQKELQALTAQLIAASETEKRRLARELHDSFSQQLAGLGMEISDLRQHCEHDAAVAARIEELGQRLSAIAGNVHRIARLLHPAVLDDLGLEAALREECGSFSQQFGIPVTFDARDVPRAISDEIALCLYRVAQESLRNIGKHAEAKRVVVRLAGRNGDIVLSIRDIGDGFDLNEVRGKGGLGLVSMEERVRLVNGVFDIQSEPGKGTRVELRAPLGKKAATK
jgi:signal transduction histidine kinase